jgi:serine/threonine-protein kinase RsbW
LERTISISSQLININKVRSFLEEVYKEFSLETNSFNRVFLGISEAVNNAILHGNRLDPEKWVFIKMYLLGKQLQIEVEDEGDGFCEKVLFNPTTPENVKREHGRGIFIMKQLAEEVVFKEGGRKVYILFTVSE